MKANANIEVKITAKYPVGRGLRYRLGSWLIGLGTRVMSHNVKIYAGESLIATAKVNK